MILPAFRFTTTSPRTKMDNSIRLKKNRHINMLEVHTFAKPEMKFKIKWGNCFTLHLLHIANYLHPCLLFEGKYFYGLWLWRPNWSIRPELIPASLAWREYFYSPVDGMLVHRRVTPSIKFAGTHLYVWVERGTVRVKCLAQERDTMSLARQTIQWAIQTSKKVHAAHTKRKYVQIFKFLVISITKCPHR